MKYNFLNTSDFFRTILHSFSNEQRGVSIIAVAAISAIGIMVVSVIEIINSTNKNMGVNEASES